MWGWPLLNDNRLDALKHRGGQRKDYWRLFVL
jgi:hypothetical protein